MTQPVIRYCGYCGALLPAEPPTECAQCRRGHWRNAKPCAGALVMHDGTLLLVRRATDPYRGFWDVPGGYCEADEHPYACAVREVAEETGLTVEITGFLGMWVDDSGYTHQPAVALNVYYHAVPIGEPCVRVQPEEVSEYAWFAPGDVPNELAFPGHVHLVVAAWRAALAAGDLRSSLRDRPAVR